MADSPKSGILALKTGQKEAFSSENPLIVAGLPTSSYTTAIVLPMALHGEQNEFPPAKGQKKSDFLLYSISKEIFAKQVTHLHCVGFAATSGSQDSLSPPTLPKILFLVVAVSLHCNAVQRLQPVAEHILTPDHAEALGEGVVAGGLEVGVAGCWPFGSVDWLGTMRGQEHRVV